MDLETHYDRRSIQRKNCNLILRGKKYQQIEVQSISNLNSKYKYGKRFYYSTSDNIIFDDHILIRPKYHSLKEELLMNEIKTITLRQFNHEYQKALKYYKSDYCKSKYRPYHHRHHDDHMTINHILAMMIYTNFTQLQYLFSNTYRDNIHQHNNYYHLGLLLKQCVHIFGKRISDGKIRKFYHGINQQMTFPSYIKNVCIRCPLSTSTNFDVALNFATNNGMVIEFSGTNTKYISIEWLSDFPHEHECLFIQNDDNHPLRVNNIIQTNNGIEYNMILDALRKMGEIIYSKKQRWKLLDECSSDTMVLMTKIREEQLTTDHQNSMFNDYALDIMNTYFKNHVDDKQDCIRLFGLFYFYFEEDNLIKTNFGLYNIKWLLIGFGLIWNPIYMLRVDISIVGSSCGNTHWRV